MAKTIKPNTCKLSKEAIAGLDNTDVAEKQPQYILAESETEYRGRNNARIVLGRDREHSIASGYGGRGHTMCGAIDLVVGLSGFSWEEDFNGHRRLPNGEELYGEDQGKGVWINGYANKNFGSMNNDKPGDAARIYISQRADIDNYFDICAGSVGMSGAESAVGIKADQVRIMARKGIKLVTGKNPPGKNSYGGEIGMIYGIDLIAGNRDVDTGTQLPGQTAPKNLLQPIPKGDNLEELLNELLERTERLNYLVSSLLMHMVDVFRSILMPRYGANAGGPVTTTMDPASVLEITDAMTFLGRLAADFQMARYNMTAIKSDYLNIMGPRYINSRWNRTN